jgi:hypothetical protein
MNTREPPSMMKLIRLASDSEVKTAGQKMVDRLRAAGVDISSKACHAATT